METNLQANIQDVSLSNIAITATPCSICQVTNNMDKQTKHPSIGMDMRVTVE